MNDTLKSLKSKLENGETILAVSVCTDGVVCLVKVGDVVHLAISDKDNNLRKGAIIGDEYIDSIQCTMSFFGEYKTQTELIMLLTDLLEEMVKQTPKQIAEINSAITESTRVNAEFISRLTLHKAKKTTEKALRQLAKLKGTTPNADLEVEGEYDVADVEIAITMLGFMSITSTSAGEIAVLKHAICMLTDYLEILTDKQ